MVQLKKKTVRTRQKSPPTFQKKLSNLEKSTFLIKAILCLAKEDECL